MSDGALGARAVWRLIVDGPGDGAWNMAVDRAIQAARDSGEAPPTLRLYRWARPTVTLGAFQASDSFRAEACARYGIDVVRRPTGGRGVLHDDEVTYSVVASTADGIPRGVVASYRHICSGLVAAFVRLGIDCEVTTRTRGVAGSAACYLHAAAADVSAGARKLSGSAQVWKGETVLQHGSIIRTRDVEREGAVFGLSPEETALLAATALSLSAAAPAVPDVDTIIEALVEAFAEALEVRFAVSTLGAGEAEMAEAFREESRISLPFCG